MRAVRVPDASEITAAATIVHAHLAVTPVVPAPMLGPDIWLKLETLQPTGSFKVRGALVAVTNTLAREPRGSIVTASAGNHGLGIAFAADRLGATATIVVPTNASEAKLSAIERFAVALVRHGTSYDEAEAHALALGDAGATFISPYNDPDVIAGQGTIVGEVLEQVPEVATIVTPIGGGGLASGLGLAASTTGSGSSRRVRVVGVEAEQSPAFSTALAAGRPVPITPGPTLADGLGGNFEAGSVTFELVQNTVANVFTVTEEEIANAMRFLAREHGIIVEGSGAVGVAGLLAARAEPIDGPTVVIITGRNIATSTLTGVLAGRARCRAGSERDRRRIGPRPRRAHACDRRRALGEQRGTASVPPRVAAETSNGGLLAAMPGYLPGLGALGAKLVTVFPTNTDRPTHQAVILLFEPATGTPIALVDGTLLTATRTAAASAVATRELARADAEVMAILGTGVQARAHALAVPRVCGALREIRIAGRNPAGSAALATALSDELECAVIAAPTFADALAGADIVCATTHSPDPVVRREWLSPGVHVNSVGFNTAGREVDEQTVLDALVVVESRTSALAPIPAGANELLWPIRDGVMDASHVHAELGELVAGARPGRTDPEQITLYKSVGVAVEDLAAAMLVVTAARTQGVGAIIDL